jgi:tetratricopeptide (TPR) repeat protein
MRRGDLDDAAAALQRAIDSGSPSIVAQAAYDLGCLLEEQGDIEGARTAYRRAVHCGPPGVRENAVRALLMLDDPLAGE